VPSEVDPNARPELVDGVCLSTDIKNYTSLAEGEDPRALAVLMSEYFSTLSDISARWHGLLMGRAGDSGMCVWSRPKRDSFLARRLPAWLATPGKGDREMRANACRAAIEIRDAVGSFTAQHPTRSLVTRIGLHTGAIALGPVGGEYHVMGDTPNTASRIQTLNKQFATTLLASVSVVRDLEDLCVRPLGNFALRGKSGELGVVEIIGPAASVDHEGRELCRRFAGALQAFENGRRSEALRLFQDITLDYPSDGPARYFREMCERQEGEG
jgi:adenylate cyclase